MTQKIIALVGEIGSGKGTVSEYFVKHHGACFLKFSEPLRRLVRTINLPETRENLINLGIALRNAFGEDILSRILAQELAHRNEEIIIIDGARTQKDLSHLETLPGYRLVYIDASEETRYRRITQRQENAGEHLQSREQFQSTSKLATESGIQHLKTQAHVILQNEGNIQDLHLLIDQALKIL